MTLPLTRLLTRAALAAALVIGLLALPVAAPAPPLLAVPTCVIAVPALCPCWPAGLPAAEPLICYASPGSQTNTFAYYPGPPRLFAQITDFYCRANGVFRWVSPAERISCQAQLDFACDPPPCALP